MDYNENNDSGAVNVSIDEDGRSAVNSLILDYYRKFGKKRDLEQYFSLSTAQSDIRDPTSLFWSRMKAQTDSSDSGERKSESSTELCRISIKCSMPEPSSSQEDNSKTKSDSGSPPIITEEPVAGTSRHSDDESIKSDDNNSQKSIDETLDISANKPVSPTNSFTFQRKLEWDSLGDVGYGNESDRKNSASSLSTLERLALKQQYSNNDTKQNSNIGAPTAHSTPVDQQDNTNKSKKALMKKTTKIYQKDIDFVEINAQHHTDINPQSINVNVTKHISFNVEKDGAVTLENVKQDVTIKPEKVSVETEITPLVRTDKEIQTSLIKCKGKSSNSPEIPNVEDPRHLYGQRVPVLINLNTLKRRNRRRKLKSVRRKLRKKMKSEVNKEIIPMQERSVEQVSEAESFEYMPGHMYHQNHMKNLRPTNVADNKSSLESSGPGTTDSSKGSKYSFTKDLEKSIELLKTALHRRYDDSDLKKRLIKEVIQRLLKSKYRDDESTTEFLSGLSFSSKKLGLSSSNNNTTSTSNTESKAKFLRPKKSILRLDKFNPNAIASTSQSAPNLPSVSNSELPVISNLIKQLSSTESDVSSKEKNSSDAFAKTSSDELYHKYIEALQRERAYKMHLKGKEMLLKQKLVCSDTAIKVTKQTNIKSNERIKDLVKDLTSNNYNEGSGDASKLEGASNSNMDFGRYNIRKQRSHSVFTLSSNNSNGQNKNSNLRNRLQETNTNLLKVGCSSEQHYCCCPYHSPNVGVADSSVQVNIKNQGEERILTERQEKHNKSNDRHTTNRESPRNIERVVADNVTGDIKYICLCPEKAMICEEAPENLLIYKCSRLTNKGTQLNPINTKSVNQSSNTMTVQCVNMPKYRNEDTSQPSTSKWENTKNIYMQRKAHSSSSSEDIVTLRRTSKSSQTNINLALNLTRQISSQKSLRSSSSEDDKIIHDSSMAKVEISSKELLPQTKNIAQKFIHESTRCIQTEISINPKISDPSLTDINIINDANCAKLICEQHREVCQGNSQSEINDKNEIVISNNFSETDLGKPNKSEQCRDVDNSFSNTDVKLSKERQTNTGQTDNNLEHQVANTCDSKQASPDNFTIPIQGTNMTLMVSIGSVRSTEKGNASNTKEVIRDKEKFTEITSFVNEKCSKAVQSQNNEIFTPVDNSKLEEFPGENEFNNKNVPTKVIEEDRVNLFKKACIGDSNFTDKLLKYNTYPKSVHISDWKIFTRSNTDRGVLESVRCIQTDQIDKKDIEIQKDLPKFQLQQHSSKDTFTDRSQSEKSKISSSHRSKSSNSEMSSKAADSSGKEKGNFILDKGISGEKSSSDSDKNKEIMTKDPILNMIQDITKRYSKKDVEKSKKRKCFKEIMSLLNYLLDTDDSTDLDQIKTDAISSTHEHNTHSDIKKSQENINLKESDQSNRKEVADKAVQLSAKKSKAKYINQTESSDIPASTDLPSTSSDSATCKILNKIKRECEKYHQRRCKSSHNGAKKCEASSTTSTSCQQCKRIHHCSCRSHKCKGHKSKATVEKIEKKCVAYNLVIQTSDSMVSEETVHNNKHTLQNIIVKVPSKRKSVNVPFKEMSAKIEKNLGPESLRSGFKTRSRSLPNESEVSSTDDVNKRAQAYTIRDYLERNRPDFVEKCSKRQNCLKLINESRTEDPCGSPRLRMVVVHTPKCSQCMESCNLCCGGVTMNCNPCFDPYSMQMIQNNVRRIAYERAAHRELLSLQLERGPSLNVVSETDLRHLAEEVGVEIPRKKVAPKFISEHEMKNHSKKIYKSLPEVVQKKEEAKKDSIKKTNLLMASIFKKNLQKKTLRGAVNLSNYSTVIKL